MGAPRATNDARDKALVSSLGAGNYIFLLDSSFRNGRLGGALKTDRAETFAA